MPSKHPGHADDREDVGMRVVTPKRPERRGDMSIVYVEKGRKMARLAFQLQEEAARAAGMTLHARDTEFVAVFKDPAGRFWVCLPGQTVEIVL